MTNRLYTAIITYIFIYDYESESFRIAISKALPLEEANVVKVIC